MRRGAQLRDGLAHAEQVRVDRQRDLEGGTGLGQPAGAQADLAEAGDGTKMARLQQQERQANQKVQVDIFKRGNK